MGKYIPVYYTSIYAFSVGLTFVFLRGEIINQIAFVTRLATYIFLKSDTRTRVCCVSIKRSILYYCTGTRCIQHTSKYYVTRAFNLYNFALFVNFLISLHLNLIRRNGFFFHLYEQRRIASESRGWILMYLLGRCSKVTRKPTGKKQNNIY